ncbi:MAG: hypothetical protein QXP42_04215 [Candidatus Micrarchaeia archaeon]
MYHPGKVLLLFSAKDKNIVAADSTTQALLQMWDEKLLTLLVDSKIADKMKENDIVLVDYRPLDKKGPAPTMVVTKVVHGEKAKLLWDRYTEYYEKIRKEQQSKHPVQPAYIR